MAISLNSSWPTSREALQSCHASGKTQHTRPYRNFPHFGSSSLGRPLHGHSSLTQRRVELWAVSGFDFAAAQENRHDQSLLSMIIKAPCKSPHVRVRWLSAGLELAADVHVNTSVYVCIYIRVYSHTYIIYPCPQLHLDLYLHLSPYLLINISVSDMLYL